MYKKIALLLTTSLAVNAEQASKEVLAGVKNLAPTAEVSSMEQTPIKGLSEIVIETGRGGEVYYISDDGKYLLNGNMIDTTSREDLTENKKSGIRIDVINKLDAKQRIDFLPDEMKHHVTVFTDIDCGYCRKLHNQIDGYNALGIGISYLFFPRSGVNTPSFDKAITVWCSKDQQSAMTNAKSGVNIEEKKCENPILEQYEAGKAVGVTGTPAMVLDNGKILPGYLPPDKLLERLEILTAK